MLMVASGGLALKNDDSLSNANSFSFLALQADCLRSWALRTSQKSSEGSTGKGKKNNVTKGKKIQVKTERNTPAAQYIIYPIVLIGYVLLVVSM